MSSLHCMVAFRYCTNFKIFLMKARKHLYYVKTQMRDLFCIPFFSFFFFSPQRFCRKARQSETPLQKVNQHHLLKAITGSIAAFSM